MFNSKKFYKLFKNRVFATIFLSVSVFILIFFIISNNFFYSQNKFLQNIIYNSVNLNTGFTDEVAVLAIDEKTLEKLGRFPFNRERYVNLIDNLNELGVGVIGFDIIFADTTESEIDNKFAKAIKKSGNVILGGIDNKCETYVKDRDISELKKGECLGNSRGSLKMPLDIFTTSTFSNGFFTPNVDDITKKVYTFSPLVAFENRSYNHFSVAMIRAYYYYNFNIKGYKTNTGIFDNKNSTFKVLNNIKFLLSNNSSKEVLINYIPSKYIKTFSFVDLYDKNSKTYKELKDNKSLEGKIVIIGAEAKGIKDVFLTPRGITYGVNIHANILNTFFKKRFLVYFDKKIELLLISLLIFLSIYFFLDKKTYIGFVGNLFIILLLIILFWRVSLSNILINYLVEIIFSLFLSLTLSNLIKFLIENKNKKVLVKALSEYISEDIAKNILSDNEDLKLDGDNKRISIFFSDIAGFTTISEKMNAEKLVIFLREYLGAMSHLIMDEKGFINKYEGDAIMALYGVFGYEDSSTYDNCKAALLQQSKLKILNKIWEKQFGEILKVRMGLHTGDAIVGNIGAKGRKMEFTALGDSVNLASRLEGVNKFYGTYICASESIVEEVGDKFEFRKLDKIRVKGKNIPLIIYELLSEKGKLSDLKNDIRIGFESALEAYFNKEFKKAGEMFKKLGEIGDPVSSIFARRCLKFEISGVKDDWDGVWTMEEK